ncbi:MULTISPECIES: phytoene desaturase family protein [unclassified Arcicella]|uniref:phytoene desaturase family protein n=1 Tax=unclassified Arcicella TaxID=2644986 RepID=UPI0028610F77|nr:MULTISPECIES: phytoene desaturase family protein [unclassified Arcicella]MDR6564705.1 phytoene desaturase [Arcicella sp. BE51]MDR6814501.1 phytoene desaturase [Arcicella sp. BE140]MDR6825912.1 phytoene desaturase [Arcicella sp. BE139]
MKVIVIGSGFSGLSAATSLADKGYEVTILEKNSIAGGRARVFEAEGFTFDMGPSWYWMPDVFDNYFAKFNKKPADYYDLVRLDPSYAVIFAGNDTVELPASLDELGNLFEGMEAGSKEKFKEFLRQAEYKYDVGMNQFVWKPSVSITEFLSLKLLYDVVRLDVFQSFASHIRKFFKDERILKLMEFPILFLGATPENTPAMYSLMNYAEMKLGTWYPMGGMFKIVEGMVALAKEKGVTLHLNHEVQKIEVIKGAVKKVITNQGEFIADVVVASSDYHHVEDKLLEDEYQNYDEDYWNSRVMSPSSLLFYLGVNKKIPKLLHHNLFFDEDFKVHAHEIYTAPQWPSKPLFYVSAPSKTDDSVAPEGCENIFLLIPVAPDLIDTDETREQYYHIIMERLEKYCGVAIRDSVVFKRSYAHNDFKADYHAFKGNAYGLANTLMQTALLKPSLKSKKVKNLFYTGQLTVPGPGVPPSLISGIVVAEEVSKAFKV